MKLHSQLVVFAESHSRFSLLRLRLGVAVYAFLLDMNILILQKQKDLTIIRESFSISCAGSTRDNSTFYFCVRDKSAKAISEFG